MFKSLSDAILSLVFPRQCSECLNEVRSSSDGTACSECWSKTRIFDGTETLCNKCGAFSFGGSLSTDRAHCRKCNEHHYDRAFSVGIYEYALSSSILRLKRVPRVARRLKLLLRHAGERLALPSETLIIPVPLSPRRRRERGFNQAAVIARILDGRRDVIYDEQTLIRKIDTPIHRAGMDRKARAVTVRNAFAVTRPRLIANRCVLLVDDVLTSGETASTCAKLLKENGAATVNVLTVARAA